VSVAGNLFSFGLRPINYGRDIVQSRGIIVELTRREFKARHLGSGLGLLWAFMHPAILMTIYCLVFNYALPVGPINGVPFLVVLLAGMVPWFFASDCIGGAATAITDNRFLVKKVVFRTTLLPIVRLLSNLPVHLFLLAVLVGICWGEHHPPTWYTLQVFYYLICLLALGLGWTLLMSALVPFLKDIGQVVQVVLQVGFWATPLIWHVEGLSTLEKSIAYLNPLCYIVEGYRESLVYHKPIWIHPLVGLYFWCFTLAMLVAGGLVFARLRPHFADVL
jgi:lipopolysaccharide transport system permease protein/teichoic acid transport system permease protein